MGYSSVRLWYVAILKFAPTCISHVVISSPLRKPYHATLTFVESIRFREAIIQFVHCGPRLAARSDCHCSTRLGGYFRARDRSYANNIAARD
jgi:hypothetical protein